MYYVETPAIASITDVMKTTVWGESGFPARFLGTVRAWLLYSGFNKLGPRQLTSVSEPLGDTQNILGHSKHPGTLKTSWGSGVRGLVVHGLGSGGDRDGDELGPIWYSPLSNVDAGDYGIILGTVMVPPSPPTPDCWHSENWMTPWTLPP